MEEGTCWGSEPTQAQLDQMNKTGPKGEHATVRKVVQNEVKRLNIGTTATNRDEKKTKCQTCIKSDVACFICPGKNCSQCFECGDGGHFKRAPNLLP